MKKLISIISLLFLFTLTGKSQFIMDPGAQTIYPKLPGYTIIGNFKYEQDLKTSITALDNVVKYNKVTKQLEIQKSTVVSFPGLGTTSTTAAPGNHLHSGVYVSQSERRAFFACGVDSTLQLTTTKFPMGYSQGIVIDTLVVIMTGGGISPSVTPKVFFGNNISQAGTALITTPSAVTSVSTATKVSVFNNAAIPSGNMIWLTLPTVTSATKNISVILIGHRL
jgi:hypothetical protein